MEDLKFTQEIKTKWLEALKSGKYIQGVGKLKIEEGNTIKHCCLGVLCEIHPRLEIKSTFVGGGNKEILDGKQYLDPMIRDEGNYPILNFLLGISGSAFYRIYDTNDTNNDGKYTAVIPLIEQIATVD